MRYEDTNPEQAKEFYDKAVALHEAECGQGCTIGVVPFDHWQAGWQDSWIDYAATKIESEDEPFYAQLRREGLA